MAGIHRSSTLINGTPVVSHALGMAGIHRSSTLHRQRDARRCWGWPGFTAQVHSRRNRTLRTCRAGDGRDSPLKYTAYRRDGSAAMLNCWGWPGFTAQVHLRGNAGARSTLVLGMAGIHRSSTLYARSRPCAYSAGDGRDSPLKYTRTSSGMLRTTAGDGRDSPLKYTCLAAYLSMLGMAGNRRSRTLNGGWVVGPLTLGMAGNCRSRTLGRLEPTDKK